MRAALCSFEGFGTLAVRQQHIAPLKLATRAGTACRGQASKFPGWQRYRKGEFVLTLGDLAKQRRWRPARWKEKSVRFPGVAEPEIEEALPICCCILRSPG